MHPSRASSADAGLCAGQKGNSHVQNVWRHSGGTEYGYSLGEHELRIKEGQMISSQASANFPLPEGVSLQDGTILMTSPPVDPGNKASYETYPIDININDTPDTKDDMVRKEQKIGTTAWRQWIPCTVKIPDTGPGKTIASIGITAESGTMKFSDAQTKPGDSDAGTSTVNLTLDAQGQGRFWITGITQSTHKGDAKLQIRKDGANGNVLATKPLTVFWFDSSVKAEGTGDSDDTAVTLSADKKSFGLVLGSGMSINASGSVVPTGLDHAQLKPFHEARISRDGWRRSALAGPLPCPDWQPCGR